MQDGQDPTRTTIDIRELRGVSGVADDAYERLACRYGAAAQRVLGVAAERAEHAEPIVAGLPDLLAEVGCAARREQARSIADVLLRRTRLGLLAARDVLEPATLGRVAATLSRRARLGRGPALERSRALSRRGRCRGDRP